MHIEISNNFVSPFDQYLSIDSSDGKKKYVSTLNYIDKFEISETLCNMITCIFNKNTRNNCLDFCSVVDDIMMKFKVLSYCTEYEDKEDTKYPSEYILLYKEIFYDPNCNLSTRCDVIEYLIKCFSSINDINKISEFFVSLLKLYVKGSVDTSKNIYKLLLKHYEKFDYVDTVYQYVQLYASDLTKIEYAILASQLLLNKNTKKEELTQLFLSVVDSVEYNKKADIYDLLYTYADEKDQEIYRKKIRELGSSDNFYENKQNVHNVDMTNLNKILDKLESYHDEKYMFEDIEKYIISLVESLNINIKDIDEIKVSNMSEQLHKVKHSLTRIFLDKVKYCDKYTAQRIFLNMFALIQTSEFKYELEKRMVEELIDMAFTCTSGHILKIINITTGFIEDIGITLSFREEINVLIKKKIIDLILSSEEYDEILIELGESSLNKPKYNEFYRKNLMNVIDELKKIYVPMYVKDDEFDLYVRDSIMKSN